jgi:hypothetical protein
MLTLEIPKVFTTATSDDHTETHVSIINDLQHQKKRNPDLSAANRRRSAKCDEVYGVISLAPGTKVFLARRPVDLRNGFDGLAAKAQQMIGVDPFICVE